MNVAERSVLGGPHSPMHVRHVRMRGSNFDIGHALASIHIERHGHSLSRFESDSRYVAARRLYFERNYPIHSTRMRGVAAAFGVDAADDRYDFSALTYHLDLPVRVPGCSVVYYPPSTTSTGCGYLSRNYDFSTGSLSDLMHVSLPTEASDHTRPMMSEPYIMEWYPEDGGYASLAIHAFDICSGTLDGINSEGVTVSIMADEEAIADLGKGIERHPVTHQVVGLHELQVMRYLLDTCATVDEAREALLTIKQYYFFVPCHYIVADQTGQSFVYENSTGRNVQYLIDGRGRPQIVTNFQLHKHPDATSMPGGELTLETNAFWRYQELAKKIDGHEGLFSPDEIRSNSACVNVQKLEDALGSNRSGASIAAHVPVRTLWHSLYNQLDRTAEFSFYVGESTDAEGRRHERRSDYVKFRIFGHS